MDEKNSFMSAHEKAMAAAKKKLPKTDVNKLISYVVRLLNGEKPDTLIMEIQKEYGPSVKLYIKTFAGEAIKANLLNSNHEVFQKLGKDGFAHTLVKTSPKVFKLLESYFKHGISAEELINQLSNTGIHDLGVQLLKANGIDVTKMADASGIAMKLGSPIVAYQASMAAYREYRKALNDLNLAREERMKVEAACNETIACIQKYRKELEEKVSEYLNLRLDVITDGFAAMDKAIMENDADGYIAGNVEIQKMLGYKVQFTNQQEFDSLMDSDEDFML